jgi:DNA-binding phage protein
MAELTTESILVRTSVTTSISPAYSSGDQIGSVITLNEVVRGFYKTSVLLSAVVVDKDKQASALDVFIFSESPTVTSVDNGAFSVSDSEASSKLLGVISIAATDYKDTALNSIAAVGNLGMLVSPTLESRSLYAVVVSRGTPTFASTSSLTLTLGFMKD